MEIKGKVIEILPVKSGQGKSGTWENAPFIIETGDQYPKKVCIIAWGKAVEYAKSMSVGDHVTVGIDIESREYNDRWYTDVKAWKISIDQKMPKKEITDHQQECINGQDDGDDSLPF